MDGMAGMSSALHLIEFAAFFLLATVLLVPIAGIVVLTVRLARELRR